MCGTWCPTLKHGTYVSSQQQDRLACRTDPGGEPSSPLAVTLGTRSSAPREQGWISQGFKFNATLSQLCLRSEQAVH